MLTQLQRYIKFARTLSPTITEESKKMMIKEYRKLRQGDMSTFRLVFSGFPCAKRRPFLSRSRFASQLFNSYKPNVIPYYRAPAGKHDPSLRGTCSVALLCAGEIRARGGYPFLLPFPFPLSHPTLVCPPTYRFTLRTSKRLCGFCENPSFTLKVMMWRTLQAPLGFLAKMPSAHSGCSRLPSLAIVGFRKSPRLGQTSRRPARVGPPMPVTQSTHQAHQPASRSRLRQK
jgi:hypothetical protein